MLNKLATKYDSELNKTEDGKSAMLVGCGYKD